MLSVALVGIALLNRVAKTNEHLISFRLIKDLKGRMYITRKSALDQVNLRADVTINENNEIQSMTKFSEYNNRHKVTQRVLFVSQRVLKIVRQRQDKESQKYIRCKSSLKRVLHIRNFPR